tara:strand:- start:733 stop:1086 length:354 start_codon:yes stop_codon:yes gene_type:complete
MANDKDYTCYQDWDTVILKKHNPNPQNNTKIMTMDQVLLKKEKDEEKKIPKITTTLKLSIQQARLNKKLSQKQLANLLGCPQNIITKYENGTAIPDNAFIHKIEKALNVKLPRIKKK